MQERFAVVFRDGDAEAAGALEIQTDRLLLRGRSSAGELEVEIPVADVTEVHVGRTPGERLNGYATVVLERAGGSAVRVAPLGVALIPELANLLVSLTTRRAGDTLAVAVPLKAGCFDRARTLLSQGPPLDPGSLGLTGHEVYLEGSRVVFVFRGSDVHTRVGKAIRHPAVWRAGVAWQRCFAGSPQMVDFDELDLHGEPAYSWAASAKTD